MKTVIEMKTQEVGQRTNRLTQDVRPDAPPPRRVINSGPKWDVVHVIQVDDCPWMVEISKSFMHDHHNYTIRLAPKASKSFYLRVFTKIDNNVAYATAYPDVVRELLDRAEAWIANDFQVQVDRKVDQRIAAERKQMDRNRVETPKTGKTARKRAQRGVGTGI